MKKNSIPSYREFNKQFEEKRILEAEGVSSRKLTKATEEYHEAQLKLQNLQKEFVKTKKEDTSKREELKKAIIEQNKIVKQKESIFSKALGDEDIDDLEI